MCGNETIRIYGYQWYIDGELVCWSNIFFATEAALKEYMQQHIMDICQEIYDNADNALFDWNDNFDPNDQDSLDDHEEYEDCLKTYQRIEHMVNSKSCQHIYEDVEDALHPLENHCDYEISWHILPYKFCNK